MKLLVKEAFEDYARGEIIEGGEVEAILESEHSGHVLKLPETEVFARYSDKPE